MTMPARLRRTLRTTALAALLCGVAPAALAQAIATAPQSAPSGVSQEQALSLAARLDALEKRNDELEAQVSDLKAQVAAGQGAIREEVHSQPTVSLANGRPAFASADGNFKFALRSVVQFDAAHYDEKPLTATNDLGSGTNFRRARLGFDATVYKDWNFALWGEFGGSGGESAILNQAYVEYAGWKPFGLTEPLRLRVGAWATPTGLEDATSNTDSLFLERAAAAELVRNLAGGDGRTGAGAFARGDRWYASAVLTGKVVGVPTTPEFSQQSGYLLRVAYSPLHGADYDTHLGASLQGILEPADTAAGPAEATAVRLQERPEIRVSGTRLVDTGPIASNGLQALGLEAGASWKNLYAAGEWFKIDVSRTALGAAPSPFDPSFSGWYLQGAWTITGERHAWSSVNGGFNGIRPARPFSLQNGGWGALEVAARYSLLDLNDQAGAQGAAAPLGGIRGGEQKIGTLGLNWYPNSVVRFLLDYQRIRVNRLNTTGARINTDANVVSLRSQFAF
ncbi:MAG: oprO [Phenylobacterium sp.]|nr:oprO [Phenylobacterium sp.]